MNKKKVINDPVYGFIKIPTELIFDLIEHPWFQRLRRIKQLGMTHLVYPGAVHSRFSHALGAMHLMQLAINVLQNKGHEITKHEAESVSIAILLHDIGHGPFSHALENSIVENINHETLSVWFMDELNKEFDGNLTLAISIFKGEYTKRFLHQLVSSQLDLDRMDYLNRDSFFTGVSEGIIGWDRIIQMLDVRDDELVVEEKGIYSIEKFLVARRIMYWQCYLHKTSISAENILIQLLKRAKQLYRDGFNLECPSNLLYFIAENYNSNTNRADLLKNFALLDDTDLTMAIKLWQNSADFILSTLSNTLINRKLFKTFLSKDPIPKSFIEDKITLVMDSFGIDYETAKWFVIDGEVTNRTYDEEKEQINILSKKGELVDVKTFSEHHNLNLIAAFEKKYYCCFPFNS